jgi:hypothetical protein
MGMLLRTEVSAGWVDKAGARLSALPGRAGLEEAMLAALAGEQAPAAAVAAGGSHGIAQRNPGQRLTKCEQRFVGC